MKNDLKIKKFNEPKQENVYFKYVTKSQNVLYVIYSNFESIIYLLSNELSELNRNIRNHIASFFCAILVNFNSKYRDL